MHWLGVTWRSVGLWLAGGALATLAGMAPAAQAQTVLNGDFSTFSNGTSQQIVTGAPASWTVATGGIAPDSGGNVYSFILNSSNAASGFNGQYGTIQLWDISNGGAGTITACNLTGCGGNFLAADSSFETGSITQTINSLVPGAYYTVSFFQAAAQQRTFDGSTTDQWHVTFGGVTKDAPSMSLASHSFLGWTAQQLTFMATASSMALSFLASGGPSGSQPPFALLDGISVTRNTTVPEPASMALLLAGVAGIAGLRRARR